MSADGARPGRDLGGLRSMDWTIRVLSDEGSAYDEALTTALTVDDHADLLMFSTASIWRPIQAITGTAMLLPSAS